MYVLGGGWGVKRWAWLMVLPWAVVVTTDRFTGPTGYKTTSSANVTYQGQLWVIQCPGNGKEPCEDFVDAMNAAHERRAEKYRPDGMSLQGYKFDDLENKLWILKGEIDLMKMRQK